MTDGRRQHPEATADEVHVGNIYAIDFAAIGWTTRRLGKIPRSSTTGEVVKGGPMRPVFAQRSEIEAAGVAIPVTGPVDHRW